MKIEPTQLRREPIYGLAAGMPFWTPTGPVPVERFRVGDPSRGGPADARPEGGDADDASNNGCHSEER